MTSTDYSSTNQMGSTVERPKTNQYSLPATGNNVSPISPLEVDEYWQIWAFVFVRKKCSVGREQELNVNVCKID